MTFDQFSVRDFAEHPDFYQWVTAPDAQTDAFWQGFLAEHPEKRSDVLQAKALILAIREAPQDLPNLKERETMWRYIREQTQPTVRRLPAHWPGWRWAAAAVVVLGLGFGGWFFSQPVTSGPPTYADLVRQTNRPLTEVVNTSTQTKQITLSDGSQIQLNPNSRVSYSPTFVHKREVYLDGEAFFKVTKDSKRPFLVYTGTIVTRVLGTSFTVRAYALQEASVTVRTGIVAVSQAGHTHSAPKPTNSVVLTANQAVKYSLKSAKLVKSLAEEPVALAAQSPTEYTYTDRPVAEIVRDIEKRYGIPIVFDLQTVRQCTVTMSLSNESFYESLNLICRTIGATYEVVDTQIRLKTKPC